MKILKLNETFLNNTNKNIYYSIEYANVLGQWQNKIEVLKPAQSITKTNTFNKVTIIN